MVAAIADLLVLSHAAFVLFVLLGGWLARRWPALVWLHVPALLWGIWIECSGDICPLTPLENHYRELAGLAAYQGDFVQHYVLAVIYPPALTRSMQLAFAGIVIAINALAYGWLWRSRRVRQETGRI